MSEEKGVVVIGATPAGLQAALSLAHLGARVTLVHGGPDLASELHGLKGKGGRWIRRLLPEVSYHPLIESLPLTAVSRMEETEGGVEVELLRAPQWVASDSCADCGICLEECPVRLDGDRRPIFEVHSPAGVAIDKRRKAPCSAACPLEMNVQGYVALIARGRYREALELIMETNPLPGVCGRVCTRPCEEACRRQELDDSIAICALKRFVVDQAGARESLPFTPPPPRNKGRIAIIGSGPAGLTAAHDLAVAGFSPTLLEAEAEPGGLLRYGIAPYRLPRDILRQEIERILALGVELRVNSRLTSFVGLERLRDEGFQAVLLAMGASKDRRMGIPGEGLEGVWGCVEFLRRLWEGRAPGPLGRVVVVGGGNAALEAARASVRCGARSVTVLYRRTRGEMPADPHEVRQALEEGVRVKCLSLPVEFVGRGGRLQGIRCTRMRLEGLDESGRPRPVPLPGSLFRIPADTAIVAIGQGSDLSPELASRLPSRPWGTLEVDPWGRTDIPWIYAAGDLVSWPSTVVEAMASGRRAARAIMRSLSGAPEVAAVEEFELPPHEPIPEKARRRKRVPVPHRPAGERVCDFMEVVAPFPAEDALKEAGRCLQCGLCSECRRCEAACELGAIRHDARHTRTTRLFSRVLVADPAQTGSTLRSQRVIRIDAAKRASPLKATVAGRAAALEAVTGRLLQPRGGPRHRLPFLPAEGLRTGIFLCSCNRTLDPDGRMQELMAHLRQLPGVGYGEVLLSACHPERGKEIERRIQSEALDSVLIASCACCPLDFACESCTEQRMRLKHRLFEESGYDPRRFSLVNIKETCMLPYKEDRRSALGLAARLIKAGLWQMKGDAAPSPPPLSPDPGILILGATDQGLQAARGLRAHDSPVVVVDSTEPDPVIGRMLRDMGAQPLWPARPLAIQGRWGRFSVTLERIADRPARISVGKTGNGMGIGQALDWDALGEGTGHQTVRAGTIVLAREGFEGTPYRRDRFARARPVGNGTCCGSLQTAVPGIYMASWSLALRQPGPSPGMAAACEGLELYSRGRLVGPSMAMAFVNERLCRGCGSCAEVCPEGAPVLEEGERGVAHCWIDPALCTGCGICAGRCPTGAIEIPYPSTGELERNLHVLLR